LTKCSFDTVELDDEWKLFHSGVEPSKFVQAGVGILVRLHLASCVDEWIPLGDKVHALESCVGWVNTRGLRVPAFAGRVWKPAEICPRGGRGLNLGRAQDKNFFVWVTEC